MTRRAGTSRQAFDIFGGDSTARADVWASRIGSIALIVLSLTEVVGGLLNHSQNLSHKYGKVYANIALISFAVFLGCLLYYGISMIGRQSGRYTFLLSFLLVIKRVILYMLLPCLIATLIALFIAWLTGYIVL